jgi:methylated-DNA-[protein]-cysteine S-methyltransferase
MNEIERGLASPVLPDVDRAALTRAIARRAEAEGLLDVAYGAVDSPLGALTVFVTRAGILRVTYPDRPLEATLQDTADRVSPRIVEAADRTDAVRRELTEYFAGQRRTFDLPVDWRLVRGFAGNVLRATAGVPFGSVTTYREIAGAAGSPNAYRAAGNALGSNPIPIVVPCHRVVHSGMGLGGYTGGVDRKRFLLALEGALPPTHGTAA